MLSSVIAEDDNLYWQVDKVPESPKWKCIQVKEESLDDLVSMVKTVASAKEVWKLALKATNNSVAKTKQQNDAANAQMGLSQTTSISILTKQVQEIKQTDSLLLKCFDQVAEQMATMMVSSTANSQSSPAGGHQGGSSYPSWHSHAVVALELQPPCIVPAHLRKCSRHVCVCSGYLHVFFPDSIIWFHVVMIVSVLDSANYFGSPPVSPDFIT